MFNVYVFETFLFNLQFSHLYILQIVICNERLFSPCTTWSSYSKFTLLLIRVVERRGKLITFQNERRNGPNTCVLSIGGTLICFCPRAISKTGFRSRLSTFTGCDCKDSVSTARIFPTGAEVILSQHLERHQPKIDSVIAQTGNVFREVALAQRQLRTWLQSSCGVKWLTVVRRTHVVLFVMSAIRSFVENKNEKLMEWRRWRAC